jgi:hypothetical protein
MAVVGSSRVFTRNLSEIKKIQELGDGVHLVRVDKEVDRPLYMPRDSEVLELELQNLERMRGSKGVVRLVAAVVSDNPYRTAKAKEDDNPTSLQGILLFSALTVRLLVLTPSCAFRAPPRPAAIRLRS